MVLARSSWSAPDLSHDAPRALPAPRPAPRAPRALLRRVEVDARAVLRAGVVALRFNVVGSWCGEDLQHSRSVMRALSKVTRTLRCAGLAAADLLVARATAVSVAVADSTATTPSTCSKTASVHQKRHTEGDEFIRHAMLLGRAAVMCQTILTARHYGQAALVGSKTQRACTLQGLVAQRCSATFSG